MRLNLTKLLDINKNLYIGKYGETSWIGNLTEGTGVVDCYAFELEVEE